MLKDLFKNIQKVLFNKQYRNIVLQIIIVAIVAIVITIIVKSTESFCAFGIIGDCTTSAETKVVDITEQIQNIDQSIKQRIDQQCLITNTATNQLNILDSVVTNLNVDQKNIIKNMCALRNAFDASVNTEAQNKVAAVIAQHAKSTGGFLGAPADSKSVTESITNSQTFIDNSMVLESIKRCISSLTETNVINIVNSNVTNTSIKQLNDQFFECLASDENTAKLAADAKALSEKQIDQSAEAEGNDVIKSIAGLFQGIGMWFFIPLAIVMIFFLFFGSKTVSNSPDLQKSLAEAIASYRIQSNISTPSSS